MKCNRKSLLTQHISCEEHKANVKRASKPGAKVQKKVTLAFENASEQEAARKKFNDDLCNMYISANIPFNKLSNEAVKNFMKMHTPFHAPCEATIRLNYLPSQYNETISSIESTLRDKRVWVVIDREKRSIVNVLIGILDESGVYSKPFLVNVAQLDKVNNRTIAVLVDDTLKNVLADGFDRTKVFLLLSDAAAYMKKAARALQGYIHDCYI